MSRPNVIVMDDNPVLRETVQMVVESCGYNAYLAGNRQEFLGFYREISAYAVILDNRVPYEERGGPQSNVGIEVAMELLRRKSGLRIALHTTEKPEDNPAIVELIRRGVIHIPKPTPLQTLREFLSG